jgi:hypothetical protein
MYFESIQEETGETIAIESLQFLSKHRILIKEILSLLHTEPIRFFRVHMVDLMS